MKLFYILSLFVFTSLYVFAQENNDEKQQKRRGNDNFKKKKDLPYLPPYIYEMDSLDKFGLKIPEVNPPLFHTDTTNFAFQSPIIINNKMPVNRPKFSDNMPVHVPNDSIHYHILNKPIIIIQEPMK